MVNAKNAGAASRLIRQPARDGGSQPRGPAVRRKPGQPGHGPERREQQHGELRPAVALRLCHVQTGNLDRLQLRFLHAPHRSMLYRANLMALALLPPPGSPDQAARTARSRSTRRSHVQRLICRDASPRRRPPPPSRSRRSSLACPAPGRGVTARSSSPAPGPERRWSSPMDRSCRFPDSSTHRLP